MKSKSKPNFSDEVKSRDRRCLITQHDIDECDACHLIPDSVCSELKLDYRFDLRNGITLTKTLHSLFDKFYWTFDIYDLKFEDKEYKFKILTSEQCKGKQLLINKYSNTYIKVPRQCYPFLYAQYQAFIHHNYSPDKSSQKTRALFEEVIKTDTVFKYLVTFPSQEESALFTAIAKQQLRDYLIKNRVIRGTKRKFEGSRKDEREGSIIGIYEWDAIIGKKYGQGEEEVYNVLWKFYPQTQATWEPRSNIIDQDQLERVCQRMEEGDDETYSNPLATKASPLATKASPAITHRSSSKRKVRILSKSTYV